MPKKSAKSALVRKGEIVRRKVHGDAHVDRRYREADEFLKMFEDVTDEFCWGTVWARPGLNKHWFRAKFFQQYRLFFRYHAATKVILYAWVNDEDTKRAYESGDDAYRIFRKMLESRQPPDDWDRLLAEARAESDRLQKLVAQTTAAKP